MQERARTLRRISAEYLRHLARPYWRVGWTSRDVLYAIDHEPGGRQHGYTTGIRSPAAWIRARLAIWLRPDGTPLPSLSQQRAAAAAQVRAAAAARREEAARIAAARTDDNSGWAGRARAWLTGRGRTSTAASRPAVAGGTPAVPLSGPAPRPDPGTQPTAAATTEPPGDGPALARALLGVTAPAERDAIIRAWRQRRRAAGPVSPDSDGS